jgi:hypothetical protein
MKRLIKYPSIEQFRSNIKNVRDTGTPKITVLFSEKIHGTNASVCYSHPDGFWVQSRNGIIDTDNDNAGCAFSAYQNQDAWMAIIDALASFYKIDLNQNIVTIYYEWCGGNIQKKSAVSGFDKMAIIFSYFKVSSLEQDGPEKWYKTKSYNCSPENNIRNIQEFKTYTIDIDFGDYSDVQKAQNEMIELVQNIEDNSPVGEALGKTGNIAEGIVGSFVHDGNLHQFKVKGTKHTSSKVKTLAPVQDERIQKIQDIAQKVTPSWRLEQMFDLANDTINGGNPDMKNMGTYMKMVNADILKEDSDIIASAGLELKDLSKFVFNIARQFFQNKYNEDLC